MIWPGSNVRIHVYPLTDASRKLGMFGQGASAHAQGTGASVVKAWRTLPGKQLRYTFFVG